MKFGVGKDEREFWLLVDWWVYVNSDKMDLDQLGIVVLSQSQDRTIYCTLAPVL